jgi:hypothetical protein
MEEKNAFSIKIYNMTQLFYFLFEKAFLSAEGQSFKTIVKSPKDLPYGDKMGCPALGIWQSFSDVRVRGLL